MNNKLQRVGFTIAFAMFSIFSNAQNVVAEKKDFMRSHEKIYVVMAVVITIVLGLFLYLINLDRKISKLEKGK